jgi:hypothetical protein
MKTLLYALLCAVGFYGTLWLLLALAVMLEA